MPDDADRIVGLYQRHAHAFDRERGRKLIERGWLDRFLASIPADGTILDVGCGGGEPIAQYIIARGYRVSGIDSSPAMIAFCRRRFQEQEWTVAAMRELALARQFDGILAWDSFFHLRPDDQRAMLPIFRAHAALSAVLMFTSGPRAGVAMGTFQDEPLYHASLEPAEYRELLAANGFDVIDFVPEDPACGGHTVWLARRE